MSEDGKTAVKGERAARISVYWPDDWKEITLTPRNWKKVLRGGPLKIRGKGYLYEGEFFWDYWYFEGGREGGLSVTYTGGGEGFIGKLSEAEVEEFNYGDE